MRPFLLVTLLCAAPATALAQPQTPAPQPTEPPERAEAPIAEPAEPAPAAPAAAPAATQPPPVLVVPLPSVRTTPDEMYAIRDAVVAGLGPHVRGRAVRALEAADPLIAILECQQDVACVGQKLAEVGAAAGVVVRMDRPRRNRPMEVTLQVHAPVSGTALGELQSLTLPEDLTTGLPAALASAITALSPHMPAPPPRTTMLLAINVDGASIQVDGQAAGTSPVAPLEVPPGGHLVAISHAAFQSYSRQVDVAPGEAARMNIDLTPLPGSDLLIDDSGEIIVDDGEDDDGGILTQWWLWAAIGGAVLVGVIVGVAVAVSGGGGGQDGFEIPPIL